MADLIPCCTVGIEKGAILKISQSGGDPRLMKLDTKGRRQDEQK